MKTTGRLLIYLMLPILALSCSQEKDNKEKMPRLKHYKEANMTKTRKRFLVLEDGNIIHYTQISKENADSIIQSGTVSPLESEDDNDKLFLLRDGTILLTQGYGGSYLYKSPDDLKRIKASTDALYDKMAQDPNYNNHLLKNVFDYGNEFPGRTKNLAAKLLSDFGLNSASLSEQALIDLDKKFLATDDPLDEYRKNFPALIAIIGEVLIKQNSAKWIMKQDKKTGVVEPHIELQGINCEFFNWLYEDIFIEQAPEKPILHETYLSVMDWIAYKTGKATLPKL